MNSSPYEIPYGAIPVAFYPYTSIVFERIISVHYGSSMEEESIQIRQFEKDLHYWFNANGIPSQHDNKIVFEIKLSLDGSSVFYGFKDWVFSIGLSVRSDAWIKPLTKENPDGR